MGWGSHSRGPWRPTGDREVRAHVRASGKALQVSKYVVISDPHPRSRDMAHEHSLQNA